MKTKLVIALVAGLAAFLPGRAQNSLWINDPQMSWYWQPGALTEASLSVHPQGLYLEYGLYLTVSASSTYFDSSKNLEAVLDFQLPKGALVVDSWLWIGDRIMQAKLIDRWSASDIYEGIVNRRRDPSVLFKNSETDYELRIYPLTKNVKRKVKITWLMPVEWANGRVEAGLPVNIPGASNVKPDLNILLWEDKGFGDPVIVDDTVTFAQKTDEEFGTYRQARIPAARLSSNPVISLSAPLQNGIYFSVFGDQGAQYYQLALSPGAFIEQENRYRLMVMIDYEALNSTFTKAEMFSVLKQKMLATYSDKDSFNLVYSKLHVEQAWDHWMPVTAENLDAAFDPLLSATLYSNLPGVISTGFDFMAAHGGQGTVVLVSNSDNFGNYVEANALMTDLKSLQDPLPPFIIADCQNQNLPNYFIGNRAWYGQEYLYVNLSKASGGYYQSVRSVGSLNNLFSDVLSSVAGMVTAFDMYTAPSDGFCFGRFSAGPSEGFPVTRTVTQIGKYYGQTPFVVNLTGIYQEKPFSQLLTVEENPSSPADTMLVKMWHGRYMEDLARTDQNNMVIQEMLYESLNNRILSVYSAFLCLEPNDTVSFCSSCRDESHLVGIGDPVSMDSSGFVKLYPNPFREKLTIEVATLTDEREVEVRIFSLTGQLVFDRKEEATPGGTVTLVWPGTGAGGDPVGAGQYIVLVRSGERIGSKRVIKTE